MIADQRKLLGLDKPVAQEVTGKDGAPLQQVNMSVDEFAKIAKEVAQDV